MGSGELAVQLAVFGVQAADAGTDMLKESEADQVWV